MHDIDDIEFRRKMLAEFGPAVSAPDAARIAALIRRQRAADFDAVLRRLDARRTRG